MVLAPTLREIFPEAEPEETVVPLTLIVAFSCDLVGVTVIDVVALETVAVYVALELVNVGERVPDESVSPESVEMFEADVPLTVAEPLAYPVLVVVIVAVDEVDGATPVTVTRPVSLIETEPEAVADPAQVYKLL
jgi:hypothetical protein